MIAVKLWWYNNFLRPYHNWRIRRMWLADPNRPGICPRAGRISRASYDLAVLKVREMGLEK